MSNGKLMFFGSGLHLAKDPVFMADMTNPDNSRTLLTAMVNTGTRKNGEPITTTWNMTVWGAYGEIAAQLLHKGSPISVWGDITSFLKEEPAYQINGKPFAHLQNDGRLQWFQITGATRDEIAANVDRNMAILKSTGRMPMQVNVTGAELTTPPPLKKLEKFDLAKATLTGLLGFAKVFIKGAGWLKAQVQTVVGNATPAAPTPTAAPAEVPPAPTPTYENVAEIAAALQGEGIDMTLGAAANIDPFQGAIQK